MENHISCQRKPEEFLFEFIIKLSIAVAMYTNDIFISRAHITNQFV